MESYIFYDQTEDTQTVQCAKIVALGKHLTYVKCATANHSFLLECVFKETI
jgi:hypothetical protein